jgi:N-acetyl-gamma-glutamyl-phosphate reductase
MPYAVDGHRHLPEIQQELNRITRATSSASPAGVRGEGADLQITFTPHLLPIDQGLLASCYVDLNEPVEDLAGLFAERYEGEAFVEIVDDPPGLRDVRDTNQCRIHATSVADDRAVVFAAIDNLWKGAAGQAVQNLNLMLGLDEGEGLG